MLPIHVDQITSENVEGLHSFTEVETIIKYLNHRRRANLSELTARNASVQLQKDLIEYMAHEFREKIQTTGKVSGQILGMPWWREWCRYVQFNPNNVRITIFQSSIERKRRIIDQKLQFCPADQETWPHLKPVTIVFIILLVT